MPATPDPPPAPPASASTVFGDCLAQVERFAGLLATVGIERGLLGPGEAARVWERHLLNCAVIAPAVRGSRVLDLGSGAGLPGLVLALMQPDRHFVLVDATRRRTDFLREAVAELGLTNVEPIWSRAEALHGRLRVDTVVARAVAPLPRLTAWALPLVARGGELVALKGEAAGLEAAESVADVTKLGGEIVAVEQMGEGLIDMPATIVRVRRVR